MVIHCRSTNNQRKDNSCRSLNIIDHMSYQHFLQIGLITYESWSQDFFCVNKTVSMRTPHALWTEWATSRLLYNPSLAVVGLSVGYVTRPPIHWRHILWLSGLNKHWLNPISYDLWASDPDGNVDFSLRDYWQSTCTVLTADKYPTRWLWKS